MKKLLSSITVLIMIIYTLTISVSAVNLTVAQSQKEETQQIVYYEDGSYAIITFSEEASVSNTQSQERSLAVTQTKAGSKNCSFYNDDDELQWVVTLRGVFSYNGSSATCTESTVSSTVYYSNWKVTSAVASKSGATAIGDFVVKRYTLLVPVQTENVHLTITCSANGNLS